MTTDQRQERLHKENRWRKALGGLLLATRARMRSSAKMCRQLRYGPIRSLEKSAVLLLSTVVLSTACGCVQHTIHHIHHWHNDGRREIIRVSQGLADVSQLKTRHSLPAAIELNVFDVVTEENVDRIKQFMADEGYVLGDFGGRAFYYLRDPVTIARMTEERGIRALRILYQSGIPIAVGLASGMISLRVPRQLANDAITVLRSAPEPGDEFPESDFRKPEVR